LWAKQKEEKLFDQGIKCLSLFFINEVAKYRQYDEAGNAVLGEYGVIFEHEYTAEMKNRLTLFNTNAPYGKYLRSIKTADIQKRMI
jgi:type III restriction enzyme